MGKGAKGEFKSWIKWIYNIYRRKAIEIINDIDGLEPYLDAFNSDYDHLLMAYESLDSGLNDIYIALNSISFIKLKTVRESELMENTKIQLRV